jgi:hypothetical protein
MIIISEDLRYFSILLKGGNMAKNWREMLNKPKYTISSEKDV